MTESISISMNDKGAIVSYDNGSLSHKTPASVQDIHNILNQHNSVDFGLLPANTRFVKRNKNLTYVVIEIPERKYTINAFGTKVENVPLPPGLFHVRLIVDNSKYKFYGNGRIFALNGPLIKTDQLIYQYPTPNVNLGGEICWGHENKRPCDIYYQSLAALEGAINTFYTSMFNDHLFIYELLSKSFNWGDKVPGRNVPWYFKKLAEFERFPQDWITNIQYSTSKTIQDLFNEG